MSRIKEQWEQDYPKAPDHFRQMVRKEVDQQLRKENIAKRKTLHHFSKVAIPVAACLVLVCGTVIAAEQPFIQEWIASLGVNKETAETLIDTSPDITYEQESPVLTVQNTYLDGTKLVFEAELKEGEKEHPIGAKDHVCIQGVDCLLDYLEESPEGSGHYEGSVILSEELHAEDFRGKDLEVVMQLYMSEKNEDTQKFAFTIPADNMSYTKQAAGQKIEIDNGTVEVRNLTVSPSLIKINLHYEFSGPDAEEEMEIYKRGNYKLVDAKGVVLDIDECMRSWGYDEPVESNGVWFMDVEMELLSFDSSSETITMIPYVTELDADGKRISGTETLYEDKAVTFSLKTEAD